MSDRRFHEGEDRLTEVWGGPGAGATPYLVHEICAVHEHGCPATVFGKKSGPCRCGAHDLFERWKAERLPETCALTVKSDQANSGDAGFGRIVKALRHVIREAWWVLKGGDDPHDRCRECGLAGIGMLRDALHDAETAIGGVNHEVGCEDAEQGRPLPTGHDRAGRG